ncbi:hypothetical protein EJ04DRAFT_581322 [Polyplosphaeria fusca]|uniref:Uncharacterized protein n=1 Tax=Polyplosphaeria fusca TaxID=682080 RepID=A0A9P4QP85_9PLEO|nr:hypothetical protein EJ04DRAFT_581322 [Polyplosphaeria fusca]
MAPASKPVRRLRRTLKKDPHLGKYCRVLWVRISETGSIPPPQDHWDYDVAHDLLTWLPNLNCFNIWGGFAKPHDDHTWTFLRHVFFGSLQLQHVILEKLVMEMKLDDIILNLESQSLKSLSLQGVDGVVASHVAIDNERTGNFTTLAFQNYIGTIGSLQDFLRWPKELKHFQMGSLLNNRFSWNMASFQSMLSPFKHSLTRLDIGRLTKGESIGQFDLSGFTKLAYVRLSAYQMQTAVAEDIAQLVIGPSLNQFAWNFCSEEYISEPWSSFDKEQQVWIQKFAMFAIENKTVLRSIKIEFNPDYEGYVAKEGDVYPWDLMDEVGKATLPHGLDVTYDVPVVTKKRWLVEMESAPKTLTILEKGGEEEEEEEAYDTGV